MQSTFSKTEEKIMMKGTHLMFECFECDKKLLNDKKKITSFLEALPAKINMRILKGPIVVDYKGNDSWDKGGITGFVLINESHISIHTFVHEGFFSADVYSCKHFEVEGIILLFKEFFKSKREKIQIVERELEFTK
ncbi:MAG: S-adenosylmethionine decarboxylase [archaeon]|nr:S-adenosylmethionine decarboxylase [archaeon]